MNQSTANAPREVGETALPYEAQIDHYLAQIELLQQQMTEDREEILHLQIETRLILEDVMATLGAN